MSNYNKEYANKLKNALRQKGYDVKLGEVYDCLAEVVGLKNHHAVVANEIEIGPTGWESSFKGGMTELEKGKVDTSNLERFEIEIKRPVLTSMTVGVYAKDQYEAFNKVQKYYDDNGDSCRDVGEHWSFEHALEKGVITDIHCTSRAIPIKSDSTYQIGTIDYPWAQNEAIYKAVLYDGGITDIELAKMQEDMDKTDKI